MDMNVLVLAAGKMEQGSIGRIGGNPDAIPRLTFHLIKAGMPLPRLVQQNRNIIGRNLVTY
jgi:hypothetical protein